MGPIDKKYNIKMTSNYSDLYMEYINDYFLFNNIEHRITKNGNKTTIEVDRFITKEFEAFCVCKKLIENDNWTWNI